MKKERIIFALGEIDEKYVKEAEPKPMASRKRIIALAVSLTLVVALSLYLFIPFAPVTSDLSAYVSSPYYPLIEEIEAYSLSFRQPKYKNNFEGWVDLLSGIGVMNGGAAAPGDSNMSGAPDMEMTNGSYVESTDNQVGGVIESDLFKMTDKYIFRLCYRRERIDEKNENIVYVLRVYSIEKENSALVSEFVLPDFEDEMFHDKCEMYLSLDGNTVTLLKQYRDKSYKINVGIISIDVSDVRNISMKSKISIDGALNTSRMVDGKLLLVTDYQFKRNNVNYADPTTFVPTIDEGRGEEPIQFDDIIYPDEVNSTNYSVVALLDCENLRLLGANALLNFTSNVYVSAENIYISREYVKRTEDGDSVFTSNMSDIAVLGYSDGSLEKKGIVTVRGYAEDQYSFDELDGYLRVVTSTNDRLQATNGSSASMTPTSQNASLYIVDLSTNSVKYSLEDFAIEGEEATAVRFDGDKVYVCTAVVVNFTDPVYFIDLSDYENITSADTGIIEGYSDHLINYGEGLTLGIGRENLGYAKVEIYAQRGNEVVSIHEYKFDGSYSANYKAYMVNRAEGLFGFGVDYFYEYDSQSGKGRTYQRYVLIDFNNENMTVYTFDIDSLNADGVRAVYIDGYIYITTNTELVVEKIG